MISRLLFLITIMLGMPIRFAIGATPATLCPSGYVSIQEKFIVISDTECPAGYTGGGNATSCLITAPNGTCIMYAPSNTTYTDLSGNYIFSYSCPLE